MDPEKLWRVVYVKSRHEKAAEKEISKLGVETYLPMKAELHQWSDRKKWIEVPLFSSYVFVRVSRNEFDLIYSANGFVRFVSLNGRPSVVPDYQITAVRKIVEHYGDEVEVLEGNYTGMDAEITSGPLIGLRGEIIDLLNGKSFVVKVDGLEKLLSVKVAANAVRILGEAKQRQAGRGKLTIH